MRTVLSSLALVVLAGCGGFTGSTSSVVSGTVVDINNQPIRDARVSSRFGSARTSTTGAFSIPRQGEGEVELVAEVSKSGRLYRGRTQVLNFANSESQSVNIVVAPEDELATLRGIVRDRSGNRLEGASVYAYFGAGSSQRAFTDEDGEYLLRDLVAGADYEVSAGGQGLRSDRTQVVLDRGETRGLDFVCGDPGIPNLDPPQNVGVVTWVSPVDATRRPGGDPAEAVKRLMDPARAKRRAFAGKPAASRTPDGDSLVEADLFWDEVRDDDLTGHGIYKAESGGSLRGVDFFADPLAGYYVDLDLRRSRSYRYAVTAISSLYPDFGGTESALSDVVAAETLGSLRLSTPTLRPLTFRWQSGSGADEFVVFLFDEFPGVDVQSVWNNSGNRATGTSYQYDGPTLPRGSYWYIVVGLANSDDSRTISQVGSFQL
jgi:hypothetical protein